MKKPFIKIGLELKSLRIKAGFTSYANFAWDNNLNKSQYWRMESGSNVTLKSLQKVLEIHNLTLLDFFQMMNKK